jgi:hypothetical protein
MTVGLYFVQQETRLHIPQAEQCSDVAASQEPAVLEDVVPINRKSCSPRRHGPFHRRRLRGHIKSTTSHADAMARIRAKIVVT